MPRVRLVREAAVGPRQDPVQHADLLLVPVLVRAEKLRLNFEGVCQALLEPLQIFFCSSACKVVSVDGATQPALPMPEVTGGALPHLEAEAEHHLCILLRPILRCVTGTVKRQIELCDISIVTRLTIFSRNFNEDRPGGRGVEIRPADIICHHDETHVWGRFAPVRRADCDDHPQRLEWRRGRE